MFHLFGRLPRLPYGVRAVPSHDEKTQTTAYYNGGSLETGRPGWFFANTYDLATRPKWEMEALTMHEAVLHLRNDVCDADLNHRIEAGEPYFHDLRSRWSAALRAAHRNIPLPPYKSESEAQKSKQEEKR